MPQGEYGVKGLSRSGASDEASGGGAAADRKASWWLPADLSSVRVARRLTRVTLTEWGFEDQVEVAELLVSELVGNAIDHAHGEVRLSLSAQDGVLRCEVEDEDPELPSMCTVDADAEGGRGLFLVDMLSCRWGGVLTARGKAVWFQLPAFAEAETASLDEFVPIAA